MSLAPLMLQLAAAATPSTNAGTGLPSSMGMWILLLAVMTLAPFLFSMITCFAKLMIVGGILRQAMGTPQIPPNSVLTGLALILTLHVMSPVAREGYAAYQQASRVSPQAGGGEGSMDSVRAVLRAAEPPIRRFLERHAHASNVELFERLQRRLEGDSVSSAAQAPKQSASSPIPLETPASLLDDPQLAEHIGRDLIILAPAFMLSELTEAFQIGFLIFIPFLVIDLVVSNVLLAMGMHMLSPVTVSMPFKLLLFVLIDGWRLIFEGIVLNYV